MKKLSILLLMTVSLTWACSSNKSKSNEGAGTDSGTPVASVYQCPMDCEKGKTYTMEGKCPVCGMDLELQNND
jgi:ABC-type Fe3+-hydroxamate transport system substrate-binding protein